MFTQQHYEKLAELISKHLVENEQQWQEPTCGARRDVLTGFAHELIAVFEKENPKFKPFKFIEAAFGKANELRKPKEK